MPSSVQKKLEISHSREVKTNTTTETLWSCIKVTWRLVRPRNWWWRRKWRRRRRGLLNIATITADCPKRLENASTVEMNRLTQNTSDGLQDVAIVAVTRSTITTSTTKNAAATRTCFYLIPFCLKSSFFSYSCVSVGSLTPKIAKSSRYQIWSYLVWFFPVSLFERIWHPFKIFL